MTTQPESLVERLLRVVRESATEEVGADKATLILAGAILRLIREEREGTPRC